MLVTGQADPELPTTGPADVQRRRFWRTGRHILCPGVIVQLPTALRLRAALVAALARVDPVEAALPEFAGVDFGECVDAAVYREGATLRMLGSRKVKSRCV